MAPNSAQRCRVGMFLPGLSRRSGSKAAFDAPGLLNPGKNVPTLHRCAEFGGLHVHHGQLPHPELERF